MTGDQMRSARRKLGLSINDFATVLGDTTGRTVRRWEGNQKEIPTTVANLVQALLADPGLVVRRLYDPEKETPASE